MAWPLVAAVALQAYGQYTANQAQAKAEEQNAEFYRYQAEYAKYASEREAKIYQGEQVYQRGQQVSGIAASNIDLTSESAMAILAEQNSSALNELNAIHVKGQLDVKLARMRAQQADQTASDLRTASNIQMAGYGLQAYGAASSGGSSKPKAGVSK